MTHDDAIRHVAALLREVEGYWREDKTNHPDRSELAHSEAAADRLIRYAAGYGLSIRDDAGDPLP